MTYNRNKPVAGQSVRAPDDVEFSPGLWADDLLYNASTLNALSAGFFAANVAAGWWDDPTTGARRDRNVGEMLCLVHSEVSEAMEGHRKGRADDKLPHRPMIEVELADVLIRIFDLAGAMGLDLGGAVVEKAMFNRTRPDHQREARTAPGGKAF